MNNIGDFVLHANKRGVPYLSLATQDQLQTTKEIVSHIGEERGFLLWSPLSFLHCNKTGINSLNDIVSHRGNNPKPLSLIELLKLVHHTEKTIIFVLNSHYLLPSCENALSTAILETREVLKSSFITIIFLSPDCSIPLELRGDILPMDVPPISDSEIGKIVKKSYSKLQEKIQEKGGTLENMTPSQMKEYIVYLRGLFPFAVENTFALAASEKGIDVDLLFKQKKEALKQIKGVSLSYPTFSFGDLAGLEGIKERFTRIIKGKVPPEFIAFIDEIGDMFSGEEDNTGTRQYMRGKFLEEMERQKAQGVLLTGVQGTGKSTFPEALAGEFNLPFVRIDLGALLESKLGNSESNVRNLFKTLEGLSGGNPFLVVGAANSILNIRPQERRRFTFGVYHFDLPTQEELIPIWDIQLKKFNLQDSPLKENYLTGAEIRNMCFEAYTTGCSIEEARELTVPYYIANMEKVRELRKIADKNYLNPTTGKVFTMDEQKKKKGRDIEL